MDQMNDIVDKVENEIRANGESEVGSQVIGEHVMKILAKVDDVTYIRFASVYREFKDMNSFMREVQEMMANGNKIYKK